MTVKRLHFPGQNTALILLASLAIGGVCQPAFAQLDPAVSAQLAALKQNKDARTPVQKKLSSQLWMAAQAANGQALPGFKEVYGSATDIAQPDVSGNVAVTIKGNATDNLKSQIVGLGGTVQSVASDGKSVTASLPLRALESLAASEDVQFIAPRGLATTNVGALTSQAYISHKANLVNNLGYKGQGVTIGVLSDSAQSIPNLIATGDLPADTTILPGKEGPANGTSEGSAMMEIISDLAPKAKLIFSTAYNTEQEFADNIRALRAAGASIIVDDISYLDEAVFQDGPVARAVNDVVASGALYFSSAGNSGSVTAGTAGVWEGDFKPGTSDVNYVYHRFTGVQDYDVLTVSTRYINLKWADALGASSNDYGLILLNAAGNTVLCWSDGPQDGTQDPVEGCFRGTGWDVGTRVLIGNYANAAPRALHLNTNRGRLSVATNGVVYGHNAGRNTVTVAATYWNSAKTGTKAFVGGAANPTETFSSDGPRRVFYQPDGTPITAGNYLFATNGGEVLQKPDITAADGVSTKTPGFLPFFGTSAAAPHAAAIAALVKSARPDYTNVQILNAMKQTALDIRAPGVDRDAGAGIVMGLEAVNYALTH